MEHNYAYRPFRILPGMMSIEEFGPVFKDLKTAFVWARTQENYGEFRIQLVEQYRDGSVQDLLLNMV